MTVVVVSEVCTTNVAHTSAIFREDDINVNTLGLILWKCNRIFDWSGEPHRREDIPNGSFEKWIQTNFH
jgi:hypothetical protein